MDMSILCQSIGSKNFKRNSRIGCKRDRKECSAPFVRRGNSIKTLSHSSRARSRTSKLPGNDFGLTSNGKHAGHTPPDQIDPQYRADHEGDANGCGLENAARAAARSRRTALRCVDEQSARFAAKTDRSDASSASSN